MAPERRVIAAVAAVPPAMRVRPSGRRKGGLWALLLTVITACTPWGPPPEIRYDNPDTQACLRRLQDINPTLDSFKGLGQITIESQGRRQVFQRAAWAGAVPGRLRLSVRAPSGLPVLSLACNAEWVTVLAHSEGRYHRAPIGDNSLDAYLPVEVRCRDLFELLRGRPPEIAFDAAGWLPAAPPEAPGTAVIALKRRFRGTVARLIVDPGSECRLRGVEILDVHGNLSYRARLTYAQDFEGFQLPQRLTLESSQGRLEIQVDRVFPNARLADELFVIAPP